MNGLFPHAPFSVAPNAGDLTDNIPLTKKRNFRPFAFVWLLVCLSLFFTMSTQEEQNRFTLLGHPVQGSNAEAHKK